jgi:hypothetical protein
MGGGSVVAVVEGEWRSGDAIVVDGGCCGCGCGRGRGRYQL